MIKNKRIEQLTFMLNTITEIGWKEAEDVVLSTKTGKDILLNNPVVLYEQQTENLAEIGDELREKDKYNVIAKKLTMENIIESGTLLRKYEMENRKKTPVVYNAVKQKGQEKAVRRKTLKEKQKIILKAKRQNKINAGRI